MYLGDVTGNYSQPIGRHREFWYMTDDKEGIGLIPLGDRDRDLIEYGIDVVEDRGCDPNIRRI